MSNSYNTYKKGSEWRKWDLHLHTASSFDAYKGDDANEKLIKALREKNISVVAITDHFLIDAKRINGLKNLAPNMTFFPGVELRTDKGGSNIHVILIFSEKTDLTELQNQFKVIMLDKKAKASDNDETIYWDYNDIISFAEDYDALISIHTGSKTSGLDKEITNSLKHNMAIKEEYANSVDIFEIGQVKDIETYDRYVFTNIGRKPLVLCSDNHDPRNYKLKDTLWIKADPTFEGLKQVIYEPKDRVMIQENKPDEKPEYQVIDSIELKKDGFWQEKIELNENLNTIIGGRATGKSSLLASIAEKLGASKTFSPEYKTFISSNISSVTINWKDGIQNDERDVDYFPQNHMFELAKNEKSRNSLVQDIVKKKDKQGVLAQYNKFISNKRSDLASLLSSSFLVNEELKGLKKALIELGDEDSIKNEKKKLEGKLNSSNDGFSKEQRIKYNLVYQDIEKQKQQLKICDRDHLELTQLKEQRIFQSLNISEYITEKKILSELIEEFTNLKERFEHDWAEIIDEKLERVSNKKEEIDSAKNENAKNAIYKKGQQQLKDNQAAIEVKKKLEKEIIKLNNFRQQKAQIEKKQKELTVIIEAISKIHLEFKQEAVKLSETLKFKESDLQVTLYSVFDNIHMECILSEQLMQRSNEQKSIIVHFCKLYADDPEKATKEFLNLALSEKLKCKGTNSPQSVITQVLGINTYRQSYELTYQNDDFHQMSQGKQSFVILKLLLEFSEKTCPILIDQPEDSLDNRAIFNELVEYLKRKKRDRQIILVTHNSNVVVSADAEQVIVANQHDVKFPNKGNLKFQYVTGSIEHTKEKKSTQNIVLFSQGIRQHICEILEGGTEAFKKREQKYQLSDTSIKARK